MAIVVFPEYPEITVGIRERKTSKIYPLSLSDIRKLKELVLRIMAGMRVIEGGSVEIGAFIFSVIEENLIVIANMVLEYPVEEEELSLEQTTELAHHIYTMNVEGMLKNLSGLWERIQAELPKAKA